MRIYTRRGDDGETDLRSGERVPKSSRRIEAYGTVDGVNTRVGTAATDVDDDDVLDALQTVQNGLFKAQADLANTDKDDDDPRVTNSDIERVEALIDGFDDELEPLTNFVLPGGARAGAKLHEARSVARRAERRAVALDEDEDTGNVVSYLNRISDLLFVLARVVNSRAGVEEDAPTY
ncbi:cob(I)yrinic acid a,c-diamide adenosyltransferase [Haladaptatus sp. F3-133]|jgi:cob(I)alamin adenosyltransferase|uniref:Cob(I)yrinic acid a,c-diamide adenosyltransferase n=1 Tax=Halorutilus salinus TaxID=2487751 RepID=A0A9Q4C537_9EURY|nr:cob(I)yrinic acid a,c-diamide adenosyltransferase [Halorutilus salinus]MCX2819356.1 cob(I)yrinic acid a,c-diamide adenosyltransferase [Halorutilus salinus]